MSFLNKPINIGHDSWDITAMNTLRPCTPLEGSYAAVYPIVKGPLCC